jgi:integrase
MATQTTPETLWQEISGPLTDKIVAALPPPTKGNRIRWDGGSGFGVRVTSAGARAFVLRYRNAAGRDTQLTIGSARDWTVAKARKRADALRHEVDTGADPLKERKTTREALTVADLADRFEVEHLPDLRPATSRDYRAMLRRHVRPALGNDKVSDVAPKAIRDLHRKIAATAPYVANRLVALLSKMFAFAIGEGMRTDNPAKGAKRAPEEKRERFLSPAEIARLSDALAAHPERGSANAVRLLLLTGARRMEVLRATWGQFDLAKGVWLKPAATTKQKKDHRLPLSAPTRQLLTEMRAEADLEDERRQRWRLPPLPFLFPGKEGQSVTDIKHFWTAICRKAGIEGVRLHDLRHTHASILASIGLSLPIIGALLGHTQQSTTHRYAHLMDDPLRAATERLGAIVTGAVKDGGEVVPMVGRRA